jgi:hypothetical protein
MTAAYEALRKADAAGDTTSAKKIADYIRSQPGAGESPSEGVQSVAVHPAEMAAEAGKDAGNWFSSNEPEDMSLGKLGGEVAGGAAGGAVAGAVLPGTLKAAGKVVPGAVGKLFSGLGEAASALPLKERVTRGAGGGAAAGAVDATGRAFGAPKAATFAGEMLAGGLGETAASFLQKEASQLGRFVANISYGNVAGASRALGGMLSPNRPLNESVARKLQQKLFGNPTDSYVDGLVSSDNRIAVQEALRKADPSLNSGGPRAADAPRAPWETSTGEMEGLGPLSRGTDVAAAGGASRNPLTPPVAIGGPKALPGPQSGGAGSDRASASGSAGAAERFAAGKAGAKAKAEATAEAARKAEADAAANAMRPASAIYRERMQAGVTEAVKQGKTFSSTPEFATLSEKLGAMEQLGSITKADRERLLKTLSADRLKNPQVQEGYAKAVDDQIRNWGKPAESGGQTGAAAVSAKTAEEVRGALREAYNGYTARLGMGDIEKKYRNAYSQEMIAQAKDELPHFLYGFGSTQEFQKMARNLARDPEGLPFIQKAMAQHLAQQEPKAITKEFERLQKVLVDSKLATPTELRQLRVNAETVQRASERGEGSVVKLGQRFQQLLLMAMARNAAAAGGQKVAGAQGEGRE